MIPILQAYGVEEADVFAIPSCLITTVSVEGKNHTKLCRVYARRTDLDLSLIHILKTGRAFLPTRFPFLWPFRKMPLCPAYFTGCVHQMVLA